MIAKKIHLRIAELSRISGKKRGIRSTRRKSKYHFTFNPADAILDPRIVPASIHWDGGAGTLNWGDADNWTTNTLPGPSDDAVIPDLTGNVTIILNTSPTIKSLDNQEGLFVQSSSTLSITQGNSQVLGSFDLQGSLSATGDTTTFNAPSTINVNSSSITASFGATLTLDSLTNAVNLNLYASGTDSSINLPDLTTISSNGVSSSAPSYLSATSNGTINLPNLTAMTRSGTSFHVADIYLSGVNSSINAQNLADLNGVDLIDVRNGGNLTLPGVTNWQTPNFGSADINLRTYDANSVLNLPNLASIESRYSSMYFYAFDGMISLPTLTTATENGGSISFYAQNWTTTQGGTIQLPALTSANNLTFSADNNGVINMPMATTANSTSISVASDGIVNVPLVTSMINSKLNISGAGSIFNIGDVTNVDDSSITLSSGAIKTFGGVTSATNLQLYATDSDTSISLPNLTIISGNSSGHQLYPIVSATSNGAIDLPNLTAISRVGTSYYGGNIYVSDENSTINAPNLADLTGVRSIDVRTGGNLTLPAVTSWQTPNFSVDYIFAQTFDSNSVLNLPNLASIESRFGSMSFYAYDGSTINLPTLATATENGGSIDFNAQKSGSWTSTQGGTIQLPVLKSANGLSFLAANDGVINMPMATTANSTSISVASNGLVNMPLVTSMVDSCLTISGSGSLINASGVTNAENVCITTSSGGDQTLGSLTTAQNLKLYASDTDSSISLPKLTTISSKGDINDTSVISATANGAIDLPNLTAMTRVGESRYGGDILLSGANSTINAPNLANLTGLDNISVINGGNLTLPGVTTWQTLDIFRLSDQFFDTRDAGSVLNLPNLKSVEARYGNFAFRAYNGSLINLPVLTTTTENGGWFTFIASNATIDLPVLPSADGLYLKIEKNGELNLPLTTSMVNSELIISGTNSIINAGNVTKVDDSCITLSSGANLTLGAVMSADSTRIMATTNSAINLPLVTTATNLQIFVRGSNAETNLPNLTTLLSNSGEFRNYPILSAASGAINLPNLTAISRVGTSSYVGDISVIGGNSLINAPKLADLSGVDHIDVQAGGNLTLPGVTDWQTANFAAAYTTDIRILDANSVLSLPHLTSLDARSGDIFFYAYDGSLIDLPALETASTFSVNAGEIRFNAERFASKINLPSLRSAVGLSFTADKSGTIRFSDDSTLINSSTIYVGVNSNLDGSLRLVNGSHLSGVGFIDGNVINEAYISPHNNAGSYPYTAILSIQGNYTQRTAGTLSVDLFGTTAGTQYDQLIVNGTADLSGKLNATRYFNATVGNTFDVVKAIDVVNDFQIATLTVDPSSVLLTKITSAQKVTIEAVPVPLVSVGDTNVSEGDSVAAGGPSYGMLFLISGVAPTGGTTISYTTTGGNPGVDYTTTSGSFTVPAGVYTKTIEVPIIGNQLLQDNRTFQLEATAGATTVTGTGLINDDDTPVKLTVTNATAQTPINSAFSPSPTVTVKNANGHLVEGATVSFVAGTGSDGSSAAFAGGSKTATAVSNASGVATAPTLTANNQVGGPYALTINGLAYTDWTASTGAMALTNEAAAVATSIVVYAGSDQSATVNTAFAQPLQVKALDANGNGVAGVTVTFAAPTTGASGSFAGGVLTAMTGADGVATSPVFTANTVAGTYNVTASATDLTSINFSLTNTAGAAAKLVYSSGTDQSAKVGTAYALPLKSLVTDTYGNPVSGVTVTFAAPGSGASATFAGGTKTAVSGADGIATSVALTANSVAGSYPVTASATGLTGTPSFTLTNTPDVASSVTIIAGNNQSAVVNTAFGTALKVKVADQFGNAVPGVTVTFAAPSTGASGAFTGGVTTAVSDTDGFATAATFTANTTAGAYSVSATVAGLTPVNFSLTNTAGAAAKLVYSSGTDQSAKVGTAYALPLKSLVTDTYGNPVSGVTVTFAAPGSGASATFAGGTNTAVSGADGVATSVALTANNVAGAYWVTASAAGLTGTPSFTLTNTPDVASSVTIIAGNNQSAVVNTAFGTALKVKVSDQYGNAVPGATVTFAAPTTGASGTFTGGTTTAVSDADGFATAATFTANTAAGAYSVSATVTGLTPVNFSLTNTAGAAAKLVYSSGTGQSAKVGTAYALPLKSLVTDTYGNPVSGVTVTFAAPGSGASATFAGGTKTAVSGADGVATSVALTANNVAGAYWVTASATGLTGTPSFTLTNTPDVASSVTIIAGNNQSAVVNTAFGTALKVKVADQFGNAVPGVTVTFAAPSTGASGAFTGGVTTAVSDADGFATAATFTANTAAGAYSVSATVAGLTPVNFSLTNTAGAAAKLVYSSGTWQSAMMTTAFTNPLVVLVTDTYDNPVSGTSVTFNVPGSGASATFAGNVNTATSNANGLATSAGLTANDIGGNYTVTASASSLTSLSFSLTNNSPKLTTFVVQKGSVGRSFLRYVDLGFDTSTTLSEIVASIGTANPRIKMTNTGIDGTQNVPYDLSSKVTAVDAILAMDFGRQGVGGNRNRDVGDGTYWIRMDLDNDGTFETSRKFFRLLGDVNGDSEVNSTDNQIIAWNIGLTGSNLAADANGDGVVNALDNLLVRRQRGRKITIF